MFTWANWNKQHQTGFVENSVSHLINYVKVVALVSLSDDYFSRYGGVREHCVKNVRTLIFVQMAEQYVFGDGL